MGKSIKSGRNPVSKGKKAFPTNPRLLKYERAARRRGFVYIAGIDEAGRGPLAGPVVAGAVLLKSMRFSLKITDSKLMSPAKREYAFHEIEERAVIGVGIVSEKVIDRINILRATARAMEKAISALVSRIPDGKNGIRRPAGRSGENENTYLLVDGTVPLKVPYTCRMIPGGDRLSLSIACASIVAKVIRDRIMIELDHRYPEYGFARHKGYGTPEHLTGIYRFGPSPVHRKTFRPLKNFPEYRPAPDD